MDFRRSANERKAIQLKQEHIRRRIDGANGAIDIQRVSLHRGGESLRADHLNDVARANVFLALSDIGEKDVLFHIGLKRRIGRIGGECHGAVLGRLLEQ